MARCLNFSILEWTLFLIAWQRYWSLNSWSNHPFIKSLRPYNPTWTSLAADVETEFRRIDKICLQTSPLRSSLVNCSLHHCLSFLFCHLSLHLTPPGFFTCLLSYHGSFAEKLWWQTTGFSPLEPGPGVSILGLELLIDWFDKSFAIVELVPCLWVRWRTEEFVSSRVFEHLYHITPWRMKDTILTN